MAKGSGSRKKPTRKKIVDASHPECPPEILASYKAVQTARKNVEDQRESLKEANAQLKQCVSAHDATVAAYAEPNLFKGEAAEPEDEIRTPRITAENRYDPIALGSGARSHGNQPASVVQA